MSEIGRIRDQLKRAVHGGAWHGPASLYVTLHGLVQHDLYHAGQMALLRKGET